MALLKKSKMPIMDIAYELGYQDAGSFMRIIKKVTHMTPSEYRKSVQR